MWSGNTRRHILELSVEEQRDFIDSFDLVLSDCDGVIWMIAAPIPDTELAINLLKEAGKSVKFVSNNSVRTDEGYVRKFRGIGVKDFKENDIVHPAKAMARYLQIHKPGEKFFSICSSVANEAMRAQGLDIESLEVEKNITIPAAIKHISTDHRVSAVLFDINLGLSYVEICKACQYLRDKDCVLISGGLDPSLELCEDMLIPGFVHFCDIILRYSRHNKHIALGKPSIELGEQLKEIFAITDPKRCLFIGDTLIQDIMFGKSCGFQTLLVLTGMSSKEDMWNAPPESQPDYYADGLTDFITLFANINSKIDTKRFIKSDKGEAKRS